MPACRHFFSLQAWHWFRWALSTGHIPVPAWHLVTAPPDHPVSNDNNNNSQAGQLLSQHAPHL